MAFVFSPRVHLTQAPLGFAAWEPSQADLYAYDPIVEPERFGNDLNEFNASHSFFPQLTPAAAATIVPANNISNTYADPLWGTFDFDSPPVPYYSDQTINPALLQVSGQPFQHWPPIPTTTTAERPPSSDSASPSTSPSTTSPGTTSPTSRKAPRQKPAKATASTDPYPTASVRKERKKASPAAAAKKPRKPRAPKHNSMEFASVMTPENSYAKFTPAGAKAPSKYSQIDICSRDGFRGRETTTTDRKLGAKEIGK
ncbi:MAG: hypothetical protein Q9168_002990 [Polycauliona sp. 1 TL-2023]